MTAVPRPGSRIGLVGRGAERAELLAALDRARSGRAGAVLLSGDAGVGKSRLVAELAEAAGDAHVVVGRCLDVGDASLPYLPFTEALAALRAPVPEVLDRWPALRRLAPWLEADAGPDPAPDRPPDRELGRLQLFDGMLSALTAAGAGRPLLLVVEDLHWADRSTRELLAFLLSRLDGQRLLVVGTYRSDDLHRRHPLRPVLAELARLPAVSGSSWRRSTPTGPAELVRALAGDAAAADEVARIAARSEGNAFFAEELVAAGRPLRRTGGLPDGLAELLLARIEQLLRAGPRGAAGRLGRRADRAARRCWPRRPGWTSTSWRGPARRGRAPRARPGRRGRATRSGTRCCARRCTTSCCPASAAGCTPGTPSCSPTRAGRAGRRGGARAARVRPRHDLPRALAASVRAASEAARRGGPAEMLLHAGAGTGDLARRGRRRGRGRRVDEARLTRGAAWAASASGRPGARHGARPAGAWSWPTRSATGTHRADARIRYALRLLDSGALMEETVAVTAEAVTLLDGEAPNADLAWAHAVAGRAALRFDLLEPGRAHAEQARTIARSALDAGTADDETRRDLIAAQADALITVRVLRPDRRRGGTCPRAARRGRHAGRGVRRTDGRAAHDVEPRGLLPRGRPARGGRAGVRGG